MDDFPQKLKKLVRIVLYGPAISQSDYRKASPYQLPCNNNDLLTGFLGLYYEIRSPIFSYGPSVRGPCVKERLRISSTDRVTRLVNRLLNGIITFQTKENSARSTHCMVRGSSVYESLVRYLSVRE